MCSGISGGAAAVYLTFAPTENDWKKGAAAPFCVIRKLYKEHFGYEKFPFDYSLINQVMA